MDASLLYIDASIVFLYQFSHFILYTPFSAQKGKTRYFFVLFILIFIQSPHVSAILNAKPYVYPLYNLPIVSYPFLTYANTITLYSNSLLRYRLKNTIFHSYGTFFINIRHYFINSNTQILVILCMQ